MIGRRLQTTLSAPSKNQKEREAPASELDPVFRLLGKHAGSVLKELETPTYEPVRPPDLPTPSPLRTLQENVFARTQFLFRSATTATKHRYRRYLCAALESARSSRIGRFKHGRFAVRNQVGNALRHPLHTLAYGVARAFTFHQRSAANFSTWLSQGSRTCHAVTVVPRGSEARFICSIAMRTRSGVAGESKSNGTL
jgi:hypothetical protein